MISENLQTLKISSPFNYWALPLLLFKFMCRCYWIPFSVYSFIYCWGKISLCNGISQCKMGKVFRHSVLQQFFVVSVMHK